MSAEDEFESAKNDNENIDEELLQHAHENLFLNNRNEPILFYIPDDEPDRDTLLTLILTHRGKVTDNPNAGYYISKNHDLNNIVYEPRFIYDSVTQKSLLKIDSYKLFNSSNENEHVQQLVSFLDDRDPTTNTDQPSSSAQESSSNQQPGSDASLRDPATGMNLAPLNSSNVINAATNVNTTTTTPASSALAKIPNKNGFTPQEDAIILEQVRRNPHRRSTHKLYDEIANHIGRHTGNSIRYRYRTHLAQNLQYVYETDPKGNLKLDSEGRPKISKSLPSTIKRKFNADDDYKLCQLVREHLISRTNEPYERDPKDVVLPGKFFENLAKESSNHTKAAWRDRYRKFAIPFGLDKYIELYELEKSQGKEPEEIKNFTGKNLYKSSKKYRSGSTDDEVGERLIEHNDQFDQQQRQKKITTSATKRRKQDSNNLFEAGHEDEIQQSANFFDSHAAAAVAAANKLSSPPSPEEFLTDDLVTAKFFEFQPIISVVDKITEIVNRSYQSGDAEQLITALYAEAGIQKKFGTFIITSVCGDLVLIPKYVEIFLKTGENPPQNIHGIWTPRDDEYLKSEIPERLDYLKRLHGVKRIELRKTFISNDIV